MYTTYLTLIQAAAVIGVACVLLISASNELFAVEKTDRREPTTDPENPGPPIYATKYVGRLANNARNAVALFSIVLAATYTVLSTAILISAATNPPKFSYDELTLYFFILTCFVLFCVCWIAVAFVAIRISYMRGICRK